MQKVMRTVDDALLQDMGNPNNPLPVNQLGELLMVILKESGLGDDEVDGIWQDLIAAYSDKDGSVCTVIDRILNEWVPRQLTEAETETEAPQETEQDRKDFNGICRLATHLPWPHIVRVINSIAIANEEEEEFFAALSQTMGFEPCSDCGKPSHC